MKKPWQPEEDEQLEYLASCAIGSVEIAVRLNRSRNAVRQRACHLKIKILPKPDHESWTLEAGSLLTVYTIKGYTVEEISAKMNREIQSVYNRSITLKLKYKFSKPSNKESLKSPIDKTDTSLWEGVSWKAHRLPLNRLHELFS